MNHKPGVCVCVCVCVWFIVHKKGIFSDKRNTAILIFMGYPPNKIHSAPFHFTVGPIGQPGLKPLLACTYDASGV